MGGLRSGGWWLAVAIISLWTFSSCGGHKPPGVSPYAARVTLNPGGNLSVQLGGFFTFTATASNSTNNTVNATFSFTSSDPSILNIAPNGVACAGHFDAAFTTCTPGNSGVVLVTAQTLGATSPPTFVFVHPPIDNITVEGVLLNNLPIQEPCLPQGQTMTVEAHVFSQGNDITASVGAFNWTANNPSVVKITPLQTTVVYNNVTYFMPTNRATVTAVNPGITRIYASSSSVFSTTFKQPDELSPSFIFDFFETCPIQTINLGIGPVGSQQPTQTSFVTSKGTSQNVTAVLTDVLGNTSLPNLNGQPVLSKIPLTWTATQPGVVNASTGCTTSCSISTPSPGAGTVTASCSPPTCNVGFPEVPPALTPASLPACASALRSLFPLITSCEQFIPVPVYATVPITGFVTGATSAATVIASSVDCQGEPPITCTTGMYSITTSKAAAGNANPMPASPNSLLFDLVGDKAYVGSEFGAMVLNPGNLNSNNSAFSSIGAVTGKVIAVSPNGSTAIFSDTTRVPNQVFVVGSTGSPIALNLSGATAAGFSGDGLKAFIFARDSNQNPTLYVYSSLQSLQPIPLPANTTVDSVVFSNNGAFAYVVEPNLGGVGPAVSVYNTCNNQLYTDNAPPNRQYIPLSAPPILFKALQDGVHFIAMAANGNIDYITATVTGITPATLSAPATYVCPMTVGHTVTTINLGQGPIHPINAFASADGTQLYVAASDRSSILVYNFGTGAVTGILLNGNASPVSADITIDSGTIMVGGNDGKLHEVSTGNSGSDLVQIEFPFLPGYLNPFCTFAPSTGPCTFDVMAVKP